MVVHCSATFITLSMKTFCLMLWQTDRSVHGAAGRCASAADSWRLACDTRSCSQRGPRRRQVRGRGNARRLDSGSERWRRRRPARSARRGDIATPSTRPLPLLQQAAELSSSSSLLHRRLGGSKKSDVVLWQMFQRLDNSPNVKYYIILWTVQDLKVGNTNSICVTLNILCYTLLWRHVSIS